MKKISLLFVFLFISKTSFAEGPCKADREKFCAGIEPGGGAVMKCLKEHESELSAECKAKGQDMRQEMKEHRQQMKDACSADVEKFCSSEKKGKGRVMKCLKKHEAELSPECKATHEQMKEMKKK